MRRWLIALICLWLAIQPLGHTRDQQGPLVIGSKAFVESYVLAEIIGQFLREQGYQVEIKQGLGGTLVAFEALEAHSIDLYPEYTGTLSQVILGQPGLSEVTMRQELEARGLLIAAQLGFENSYAIAMAQQLADQLGIATISDLQAHKDLKAGFSHEFLNRADGWPALRETYGLPQKAIGIEHALAYAAIENGSLDFTDAYTTDGELTARALTLLKDDRDFFPHYRAVILARAGLSNALYKELRLLEGILSEASMSQLNHQVSSLKQSPEDVATRFLLSEGLIHRSQSINQSRSSRIFDNVLVHLKLTGIALLIACAIAIPSALLVASRKRLSQTVIYLTGLIQTIPALALLALMIPVFGLGELPAIIALSLYSLLPIVRNTLTGLSSIDPLILDVAAGMGLTRSQSLRRIELPLAAPTLLAGIKTAAIISIGTATLAAFVGAGGLGEPIITGLNLNDNRLILEGAIPAALLAIAVELLFDLAGRTLVPAHLRKSS
ncbi:MAG: glycine betaine ABC transporter substrate-binding protein [Pseudomonadota bacterium]